MSVGASLGSVRGMLTAEEMTGLFASAESRWRDTGIVENGNLDVSHGKGAEVLARQFGS